MSYTTKTGNLGEDIACEYLKNKRYKIIGRNYRQKWGEIDIIAKDPAGVLVFVEVKTIRQYGNSANGLRPEDNLTSSKLEKLKRTASLFAASHEELVEDRGYRVDLVAVTMFSDEKHQISHYENL